MSEDNFTDGDHVRSSVANLTPSVLQGSLMESCIRIKHERAGKSLLNHKMLSQVFHETEEETVLKVLKEVDRIEEQEYKKGFKEVNFTFGVMNSLLVAYLWGAFPGYFWLVYLVESLYFIPLKFYNMVTAKPLNEALYYLDFCWMMNFTGIMILFLLTKALHLSDDMRHQLFLGCFGIGCGPVFGAAIVLPFVAFIFHDLNTMTNLIIHALPTMLMYTLRWHSNEVRESWPNLFHLDYVEDAKFYPDEGVAFLPGYGLGSIAGNTLVIYLSWFIPYTSWMLLIGLDLPRKNRHAKHRDGRPPQKPRFDTVFHSFWRAGWCQTFGTLFWKRPVSVSKEQMELDDYEVRDLLLYMSIHAVMCLLSIPTLAYACYSSELLHGLLILAAIFISAYRGSVRYTYYTTRMYSRKIKKAFLVSTD